MKHNIEKRSFKLELRNAPEQPNTIRGYAAVFDSLSVDLGGFREKLARGAFSDVLNADNIDVTANIDHDNKRFLGRFRKVNGEVVNQTLRIQEDEHGLGIEIDIPNTTDGNDIRELMKRGDIDQMSFAFNVDEANEVWTRSDEGESIREITKVSGLYDTAIVVFPAYEATEATLRSFEKFKETEQPKKNSNRDRLKKLLDCLDRT